MYKVFYYAIMTKISIIKSSYDMITKNYSHFQDHHRLRYVFHQIVIIKRKRILILMIQRLLINICWKSWVPQYVNYGIRDNYTSTLKDWATKDWEHMELEALQWDFFNWVKRCPICPGHCRTLYCIIEHGRQTDCLLVIENGVTTVGFTTFTLLAKTNKEITLDADLTIKDQHSHPNFTNLSNDFNNTTMPLILEKSDITTISTNDSAAYEIHSVEQVSIKPGEKN